MDSQWIRTTTNDTFREDVIEQSQSCPVVVDFWADWCEPCKQLMPILEKVAVDFDGRFILVKINVDEQPELAGAFGVQSIPFVIAMVDGQPASQLPGVVEEPQLRQWIESFVPSEAIEAYNAGIAAESADDFETAETQFNKAVSLDAEMPQFQIAHARALLQLGRDQECSLIVEELEKRGFLEPEAEAIKDQLALKENVEESGGLLTARKAMEAEPDNLELTIRLAEAMSVDKRYPEACELLLEVIQKDRTEVRDRAKDAMVAIMTAMGPKSRQAADFRRRLSTAFY